MIKLHSKVYFYSFFTLISDRIAITMVSNGIELMSKLGDLQDETMDMNLPEKGRLGRNIIFKIRYLDGGNTEFVLQGQNGNAMGFYQNGTNNPGGGGEH